MISNFFISKNSQGRKLSAKKPLLSVIQLYTMQKPLSFWSCFSTCPQIYKFYYFIFQERGTPPLRPPPRPQAKTCPPVSRVFKRRQELFAAQSVTFLDSTESSSLTAIPFLASQHYDSTNKASYFEQVNPFSMLKIRQISVLSLFLIHFL